MNNETDKLNISPYHLFYVEAIMQDSSFPQIHKVKPIFENMKQDEFIELVEKVIKSDDYEVIQQFLYFLLLFRDMKHIQEYINSNDLTIDILERFVIFTFGYCSRYDHSVDRIIDEILYFLTPDRLFELVLKSKFISRDKLLLFFILAKFDTSLLNEYFKNIENPATFIENFLNLPEEVLRSIIARNYNLFQYLLVMMNEFQIAKNVSFKFYEKYRKDIEQFSKLNDVINVYKKKIDQNKEKELPFNERDMTRISFLVNMIREFPDPLKAVSYFSREHVFIDDLEEKIVLAVVSDPILKTTFQYYDKMFDIVEKDE